MRRFVPLMLYALALASIHWGFRPAKEPETRVIYRDRYVSPDQLEAARNDDEALGRQMAREAARAPETDHVYTLSGAWAVEYVENGRLGLYFTIEGGQLVSHPTTPEMEQQIRQTWEQLK